MSDTHAKTRIKPENDKRLHFKQHKLQIGVLIIYEPLTTKYIINQNLNVLYRVQYTITAFRRGSTITAKSNNHTIQEERRVFFVKIETNRSKKQIQ